jgi:cysteine desulfurase
MSAPWTYLDHAASTPVAPEVLQAMLPYFDTRFGNPSSRHGLGVDAQVAVNEARRQLSQATGCPNSGVVFTSGGTESDVLALRGAVGSSRRERHVVVSAVEHSAVTNTGRALEKAGHRLTVVPVDAEGRVNAEAFLDAIEEDTAVCGLMAVSNELGTIQPIAELARRVKQKNSRTLFHVDAVQAFGRLRAGFREWPDVDSIAMSAHKIYGPKGVGALFVREANRLEPVNTGGGQEGGLRSGTHNVPGIVGLAAAYKLARDRAAADWQHYVALDRALFAALDAALPEVRVNGPRTAITRPEDAPSEAVDGLSRPAARVPYIVNLLLPETPAEPLLNGLDGAGFYVSSGSACRSKSAALSPILAALGMHDHDGGNLRISFGRATTHEDVERFVETLATLVPRLRAVARRV